MSDVLYESVDHVATITINRPEKRNAINEGVSVGLAEAWRRFAASDDRVAVLTSAGDVAFSSGRDLYDPPNDSWRSVPNVGIDLDKPIICAMTGWCIGGSMVYPLMADMIIADESVRFIYPEAKVGNTGGIMGAQDCRQRPAGGADAQALRPADHAEEPRGENLPRSRPHGLHEGQRRSQGSPGRAPREKKTGVQGALKLS